MHTESPAFAASSPPHAEAGAFLFFEHASCCGSGALTLAAELPSSIARWMRERDALADAVGRDTEAALRSLVDSLASALQDWLEQDGADAVRGRALAMSLDDALELLDGVVTADGDPILAGAYEQLQERLGDLADLGLRNTADVASLNIDGLDVDGWVATQRGALQNAASAWDVNVRAKLGEAVQRAANAALYADSAAVRDLMRDATGNLIPGAVTEMRTAAAAYDRVVSAAAVDALDPGGVDLMWVYSGPVDGLQRRFCALVTGKRFTRAQVGRLRNGTPGMPATDFGGGYNCRHQWLHMLPAQAARMGYEPVSDAELVAINLQVAGSRK